jgi:hypothetical protein
MKAENVVKFHMTEEHIMWSVGFSVYTFYMEQDGQLVISVNHLRSFTTREYFAKINERHPIVEKPLGVGPYYRYFKDILKFRKLPASYKAIIYYGLLERRTINRRNRKRQFYVSAS